MKQLKEHGIYCLALTSYQYTARRIPAKPEYRAANLAWILMPMYPDHTLLGGPVLFVDASGTILRSQGKTALTTNNLDFTGRYNDAR